MLVLMTRGGLDFGEGLSYWLDCEVAEAGKSAGIVGGLCGKDCRECSCEYAFGVDRCAFRC